MDLINNKTKDWISNTATTAFLQAPTCNSSAPKPSLLLHACNQFVSGVSDSTGLDAQGQNPIVSHGAVATSVCLCCSITALQQFSTLLTVLAPSLLQHIHTLHAGSSQHPTSLLIPNKQPEKQLPAGLKNRASSYK